MVVPLGFVKYNIPVKRFVSVIATPFPGCDAPRSGNSGRRAKRKLEAVNAASRLEDLTIPPLNRLEKLRGDLGGFYSIRINDQWRVIFKWIDGEPRDVRIVDYR